MKADSAKRDGSRREFPFSALVGQVDLCNALLWNAIDPTIGGVLVRGPRGTAKSTAARGLTDVLPPLVCAGQSPGQNPYRLEAGVDVDPQTGELVPAKGPSHRVPTPFVNLPMGASDDRVMGSLDVEQALAKGKRAFEPGLLAKAHRGVLYIDEVNLLPDHLVDLLLDVAAMGRNRVERDGVSFEHPARVMLVGTMNPEEGQLRPQLLDRFGLCVDLSSQVSVEERLNIVRRRMAFEANPTGFCEQYAGQTHELRERVISARQGLATVSVGPSVEVYIAEVCAKAHIDGVRGDLVLYKAAKARAAWHGRNEVSREDVDHAAPLALAHRAMKPPPPPPPQDGSDSEKDDSQPQEPKEPSSAQDQEPPPRKKRPFTPPNANEQSQSEAERDAQAEPPAEPPPPSEAAGLAPQELVADVGQGIQLPRRLSKERRDPRLAGLGDGKHEGFLTHHRVGDSLGSRGLPPGVSNSDIHWLGTLVARAMRTGPAELGAADVRIHRRRGRAKNLVLFVVDASGSMGAKQRMTATKGALLSYLQKAYQDRDLVGLISFRRQEAQLVLPPTRSVAYAYRHLSELPTGGRSPVAEGLALALRVVRQHQLKNPAIVPHILVLSDGRANSGPSPTQSAMATSKELRGIKSLFIDREEGRVRLGWMKRFAEAAEGEYLRLDELAAAPLEQAVRTLVFGAKLAA